MVDMVLLVGGLLAMVLGAEWLVRGASSLATSMGISPLVVGLTVVAFGTSAPEMAVSVEASLNGQADIAIGNVIGSNIFNILFILGLSALIVPLRVSEQLVRFDVPLMVGISLLVLLLGLDGLLGRADGALLLGGLLAYILFLARDQIRENKAAAASAAPVAVQQAPGQRHWLVESGLVVSGLALLVFGSEAFVDAAVDIAARLGVSELIVGLTVVAAGTSLPELMTSVVAAIRGERDIAVGNVVGSNIFNLLAVLGLTGLVSPTGALIATSVLRFDLPIMIGVAIACLPIFFAGGTIGRGKGLLLFGYYGAYTAYLVLAASAHDALDEYLTAMLYFVIPLTLITLIGITVREFRRRRAMRKSSE